MKKYLLTYSRTDSPNSRDRPECTDKTFDSVSKVKEFLEENGFGADYEYTVWEQTCGIHIQRTTNFVDVPPLLT